MESQELRQAVCQAETLPAAVRILAVLGTKVRAESVVTVHDAREYAGRAFVVGPGVSGILERIPRHLEEQSQLRIHELRFPRRHAEELRRRIAPPRRADLPNEVACPPAGAGSAAGLAGTGFTATRTATEEVPQLLGRICASAPHVHASDRRYRRLLVATVSMVGPVELRTALTESASRSLRVRKPDDFVRNLAHRAMLEQERAWQPGEFVPQGDGNLDDPERIAAECLETIELRDPFDPHPKSGREGAVHLRGNVNFQSGDSAPSRGGIAGACLHVHPWPPIFEWLCRYRRRSRAQRLRGSICCSRRRTRLASIGSLEAMDPLSSSTTTSRRGSLARSGPLLGTSDGSSHSSACSSPRRSSGGDH